MSSKQRDFEAGGPAPSELAWLLGSLSIRSLYPRLHLGRPAGGGLAFLRLMGNHAGVNNATSTRTTVPDSNHRIQTQ